MNTLGLLAVVRPDRWNFPLFLHVLGAMILVGGLLTGASSLASSGIVRISTRFSGITSI